MPLRLAWALTIHKSQGITAHQGCIVSFAGCNGPAPVGKLGLAFVAWTRATNWHLMAFHKLSPLADFLSARLTREFSARAEFEHKADAMFAKLLEKRGTSPEALLVEHERHLQAQTLANEGREPTHAELADMRAMLSAAGVAPVSDKCHAVLRAAVGPQRRWALEFCGIVPRGEEMCARQGGPTLRRSQGCVDAELLPGPVGSGGGGGG